jgi:hypothetical protein
MPKFLLIQPSQPQNFIPIGNDVILSEAQNPSISIFNLGIATHIISGPIMDSCKQE